LILLQIADDSIASRKISPGVSPFDFLARLAILTGVSLGRAFEITFYASLNRFSDV
jgi:hypothetical protein